MKTFKSMIALVLIAFCLLEAGCNQEVVETVVCTETSVIETQETTESILVEETEETTLVETSIEATESEVEEDVIPEQSSNFCEVITVSTTAETSVCGYPLATESSAVVTETTANTPTYESTPDTSVLYNGITINEYYVDGYGTVYGFFNDVSGFNSQVNQHLVDIGRTPYSSFNVSDSIRTRAIECTVSFSHTRPNGQYCYDTEIISAYESVYAFENFQSSSVHWAALEEGAVDGYTNLNTASFTRVTWYSGSWHPEASATVVNL